MDQWKNPSGNPSVLGSKLYLQGYGLCLETILPSGLILGLRPGKMWSLHVKQALLPLHKGTADERPNSQSEWHTAAKPAPGPCHSQNLNHSRNSQPTKVSQIGVHDFPWQIRPPPFRDK